MMFVVNIESVKKQQKKKKIFTAALVSLDYENLCSPYHTSKQGADLVLEFTLKRQKQPEKPNFERKFSRKKQKTRRNNPTHLTYVRLSKNNLGKNADFGLQFSFNRFFIFSR